MPDVVAFRCPENLGDKPVPLYDNAGNEIGFAVRVGDQVHCTLTDKKVRDKVINACIRPAISIGYNVWADDKGAVLEPLPLEIGK